MSDGQADMADGQNVVLAGVERLPSATQSTAVSDELNRILTMLREICPKNAVISFDFDGQLHVHIDLRSREDVTVIERLLPSLGLGLFHRISLGETPHHPFFHRISALVAR
jgi:transcriptional regulator of NAD metabolism